MKVASFCIVALAFGCGQVDRGVRGVDVARAGVSKLPLTTVTVTEDCEGGGTVAMTGRVDTVDEPAKLDVAVTYTYTACVSDKHGTVAGTVAYTKLLEEVAPDYNSTVTYAANLTYSGTDTGTCSANFTLNDVAGDKPVDKLSVTGGCQHPYGKHLAKLEKDCKLKKGKKKGKGHGHGHKCSLL